MCQSCDGGSVPRERALAAILWAKRPDWKHLTIHESSPAKRGISARMARDCASYVPSQYFVNEPPGAIVNGFRNEDLERQTFSDQSFDIVVSLDVMEHVWDPKRVVREVWRTLKPGGLFISTWPIRKYQVDSHEPRAFLQEDGSIRHLKEPEIHGNPISGDGALVTWDYGYDIHLMLEYWADFDVEITRFAKRRFGILGEYTEVIICERRPS